MTPQSKPTRTQPRPRPHKGAPKSRALTRPPRRITGTHLTWGATGLVIVVVISLLVAYMLSSNSLERTNFPKLNATEFYELTHIPAKVYDTVGISSAIQISGQSLFADKHQPPLTTLVGLKKVPYVFYWGGEYCPYCAATRWGIVAALERFGTFDFLKKMYSASNDVAPNTPTITFYQSTYHSKYFAFTGFEAVDRNHKTLMNASSVLPLIRKYNRGGFFPFLDVGNTYFIEGSVFDPANLAGATQQSIISGLSDANNPVTQVIIAEANLITAEICATNKSAPASVCTSSGVTKAAAVLKDIQPLTS